jgi:hypothetical protein
MPPRTPAEPAAPGDAIRYLAITQIGNWPAGAEITGAELRARGAELARLLDLGALAPLDDADPAPPADADPAEA